MKKKKAIKVICVVLSLPVLLTILWTLYICFSVNPHISDTDKVVLAEKRADGTYFDEYMPNSSFEYGNMGYDAIVFYKPRFMNFTSYITYGSAININSETKSAESMNGFKYHYSMTAQLDLTGKIKEYRFTVSSFSSVLANSNDCSRFYVDSNGVLLNEKNLSSDELEKYKDCKEELILIVNTVNKIFNF